MATKALIMKLRQTTGAGLNHCKQALTQSNGDLAQASTWLAEQGRVIALNKAHRATPKGVICAGFSQNWKAGMLLEVNAETDFCVKNDAFLKFAQLLMTTALELPADTLTPAALLYRQSTEGRPLQELLADLVLAVGENVTVARMARITIPEARYGVVNAYLHNRVGGYAQGIIGTAVGLTSDRDCSQHQDQLLDIARRLAMQVTSDPDTATPLLDQPFLQGDTPVGDWLASHRDRLGVLTITEHVSMRVGEGQQEEGKDFAQEVEKEVAKAARK
eukprot:NODE_3390_length_977_cov_5.307059_g3244_i0.p2 GENE.NODE_3390_length_977_cov_5.307059_g3244_i0~~NODE_3390_length_977_cov_5.307059_g3244_i0.p2  ORF type:complete len:291 (-),score=116.72 NODE_3390_length_977_cov_5.307059_g3244_i0:104-928(-)